MGLEDSPAGPDTGRSSYSKDQTTIEYFEIIKPISRGAFGRVCEDPVLKKRKGQGSVDNQGVNSIGGWLEDVGFSRYAGVFEMHEVDEQALPFLTLNDLKEMGVLALGTQRKLYAAICGLKGQKMKPNVAISDCIIGCLGKEKRVSDAHHLLKKMLESGVYPDEALYAKMINVYSKNGQAYEAKRLFNRITEHGIQPDSRAYFALISGLVKKNKKRELEFAFRLVSLMGRSHIECDYITYITLISGICRNTQCYNGVWLGSHSKSQKDREDLYHLFYQNSSLLNENDMRISLTTHKDLKLLAIKLIRGINETAYMPNLYLYNAILTGFCRMRKFEEAYDQLDVMEE
ncbi:pentatricopeptide repeat-containing protein [Tanacetum coccineum]